MVCSGKGRRDETVLLYDAQAQSSIGSIDKEGVVRLFDVRVENWAGPHAHCRPSEGVWVMFESREARSGGSFGDDRVLFDQAPDAYDRARPGYPPELIDDLLQRARLGPESRILEIGCGTGQLTRLLAPIGATMDCVELSAGMSRLARANLAAFPNVAVRHGAFEEWSETASSYDLITSAQAFHWIPPEIGYSKCCRLLSPEGLLALIWNLYEPSDDPLHEEIQAVYRREAPQLCRRPPDGVETRIRRTLSELRAFGCFQEPLILRYPWIDTFPPDRYADLLRSFSDHRKLGTMKLERLIAGVLEVIETHGGTIGRRQIAVLILAAARRQC